MDDILNLINGETVRMVFCKVFSVSQTEFFQAAQSGMRATHKVTMLAEEYSEEKLVQLQGKRYAVNRTYRQPGNDRIELYLIEKAGLR